MHAYAGGLSVPSSGLNPASRSGTIQPGTACPAHLTGSLVWRAQPPLSDAGVMTCTSCGILAWCVAGFKLSADTLTCLDPQAGPKASRSISL